MNINLFCLPPAGATAQIYSCLQQYAGENLHIIPLELPGRGSRFAEPLPRQLPAIIDDCYDQVRCMLQQPYALYGHSMGALVAYLLLCRIAEEKQLLPAQLFVSGCAGPSMVMTAKGKKAMEGLITTDRLRYLTGEPAAILESEAFQVLYKPVILADLGAFRQYKHRPTPPFPVPIAVFTGEDDEITIEESYAWGRETVFPVPVYRFKGGHQFWRQQVALLLRLIKNHLLIVRS